MTQWGLDTLFNPAKRHMDEEKQRLQSTREEIGDSSGGKRIDLESGKVTISRAQPRSGPDSDAAETDDAETDAADSDDAGTDAAESDAAETANPEAAKVAEPDADTPDGIAAGTAVQGPEGTNKSDPA